MAEIIKTAKTGSGARVVTVTTLGASDTFTYKSGDELYINNVTAGAITPKLDGDGSTVIPVKGYGDIDVSGGYDVPSIGVGEEVMIPLDTISAFLKGVVTVTAGDGTEVFIITS